MKKNNILGIDIANCSYPELVDNIEACILSRGKMHVITANASLIVNTLSDPEFRRCLQEADVVTADGMSIVWAAKILNLECEGRVAGIDLIPELLAACEKKGYKVYFLGAKEPVINAFVVKMKQRYPRLRVAGFQNGYFDDDAEVVARINRAGADVVLAGLGSPKQEKWIARHKEAIQSPVLIGVGGSFDVLSGRLSRAPQWMQAHGLEWLFRLAQEPRRLWKRYLVTNTIFIYRICKEKGKQKGKRGVNGQKKTGDNIRHPAGSYQNVADNQ